MPVSTALSGKNTKLEAAKKDKKDEFYTQLTDIEKELQHYTDHFHNARVLCNCDDPEQSNFYRYFRDNFGLLGIRKLVACHYLPTGSSYSLTLTAGGAIKSPLTGNGDFRGAESVALLTEADIVVTNPPFSLFREYIAQLIEYKKKFVVLGNVNAVGYKDLFPLIKDNKLWLGPSISSGDREFRVPDHYALEASGTRVDEQGNKYIRVKGVRWFTNMDFDKRHERLDCHKQYSPAEYPKYDGYAAINVNKVAEIPEDYNDAMGVPITFMDKWNPDQFQLLGALTGAKEESRGMFGYPCVQGKTVYSRLIIQRR